MKYTTSLAGNLGQESSQEGLAIKSLMGKLPFADIRLPGELSVNWKRSDLPNRGDEYVASLNWSESNLAPSMRITKDQLLDPKGIEAIQRSFDSAISKFYLFHSEELLRQIDAISHHSSETAVAS